jgi:hypothetical protein
MSLPNAFMNFSVAFDVALYRDTAARRRDGFEKQLDHCISEALPSNRASLQSLHEYLDNLLAAPDPNAIIEAAWNSTKPRTAFWPGPEGGGIALVFERVRDMTVAKLDELGKSGGA